MIHVVGNAAVDTIIRLDHIPQPGETVVALGAAEETVAALAEDCEAIDRINVYPVADGDTGTNMLRTMRSAVDVLTAAAPRTPGGVLAALAKGALAGARGNSPRRMRDAAAKSPDWRHPRQAAGGPHRPEEGRRDRGCDVSGRRRWSKLDEWLRLGASAPHSMCRRRAEAWCRPVSFRTLMYAAGLAAAGPAPTGNRWASASCSANFPFGSFP